ncbi:MAG: DUF1707 domain-containing protein [Propionibacteriaceae bacterium]|nr:DUF1707 domain-containing protein [Propionibacteriaceae bacterium]
MSSLHVSFKERDVYLDILSQNYSEGRLSDEEFELRQDRILKAVTHGECRDALQGLVVSRETPVESLPQPVAPPRRSRRGVLLAGVAGLGLLGVAFFSARVDSYSSSSGAETVPVEPPPGDLEGVRTMSTWQDWPRIIGELEAAGVSGVHRLSLQPGGLEGEVSLYDGRVLQITTSGSMLHVVEALVTEPYHLPSLEDFGGAQLVDRMTELVKDTWPNVTGIESIRLRGADSGGDIRVTFTEGGRTRTALIDAHTQRILDVMEG